MENRAHEIVEICHCVSRARISHIFFPLISARSHIFTSRNWDRPLRQRNDAHKFLGARKEHTQKLISLESCNQYCFYLHDGKNYDYLVTKFIRIISTIIHMMGRIATHLVTSFPLIGPHFAIRNHCFLLIGFRMQKSDFTEEPEISGSWLQSVTKWETHLQDLR